MNGSPIPSSRAAPVGLLCQWPRHNGFARRGTAGIALWQSGPVHRTCIMSGALAVAGPDSE